MGPGKPGISLDHPAARWSVHRDCGLFGDQRWRRAEPFRGAAKPLRSDRSCGRWLSGDAGAVFHRPDFRAVHVEQGHEQFHLIRHGQRLQLAGNVVFCQVGGAGGALVEDGLGDGVLLIGDVKREDRAQVVFGGQRGVDQFGGIAGGLIRIAVLTTWIMSPWSCAPPSCQPTASRPRPN